MTSQHSFALAHRSLRLNAPRALVLLLAACCSCLLLSSRALGQSATATLSGSVVDQNGAILPGAAVTVMNTGTSAQRKATTNNDGGFTVPLLPPGTYTVRVERDGFSPLEARGVVLNVGDQKALQIQLKAGDVNAQVTVDSNAETVSTDGSVGTVVDREFVANMPLNGRSLQSLISLSPGVVFTTAKSADSPGQFSVNGQRTNANYFTLDGVSADSGTTPIATSSQQAAGTLPNTTVLGG